MVDIVYKYSRTIPYKTRLYPDEIAEYARITGKEVFKHVTPVDFTDEYILDRIEEFNDVLSCHYDK